MGVRCVQLGWRTFLTHLDGAARGWRSCAFGLAIFFHASATGPLGRFYAWALFGRRVFHALGGIRFLGPFGATGQARVYGEERRPP